MIDKPQVRQDLASPATTQLLLSAKWAHHFEPKLLFAKEASKIFSRRHSKETIFFSYELNFCTKNQLFFATFSGRELRSVCEVLFQASFFADFRPVNFSTGFYQITYKYNSLKLFLKQKLNDNVSAFIVKQKNDRSRSLVANTSVSLMPRNKLSIFFTAEVSQSLKELQSKVRSLLPINRFGTIQPRTFNSPIIDRKISPTNLAVFDKRKSSKDFSDTAFTSLSSKFPKLVIKSRSSVESPTKCRIQSSTTPEFCGKVKSTPQRNLQIEIPNDDQSSTQDLYSQRQKDSRTKVSTQVKNIDKVSKKPCVQLLLNGKILTSTARRMSYQNIGSLACKTFGANRRKSFQIPAFTVSSLMGAGRIQTKKTVGNKPVISSTEQNKRGELNKLILLTNKSG